jgi:hypothetical protein
MDVSSGFDHPNPFGLRAADFDFDQDSYVVALRFLSDLASGTEEKQSLEINGASEPMLRNWESSAKFRRVLAKCRAAGMSERAFVEQKEAEQKEAETATVPGFVPLDRVPVRRPSVFSPTPDVSSWGDASFNVPG